jgi:hypothetical protein
MQLYGSVQLITSRPGSAVNLNAPGRVDIMAPEYAHEIVAQGWIKTADGILTSDVTLDLSIDLVDFQVRGAVTVSRTATLDNTSIEKLMADVRAALAAKAFTVVASNNAGHAVGSSYTFASGDPDVHVELRDGRLVLASPYAIALEQQGTAHADLLGFDTTGGRLVS